MSNMAPVPKDDPLMIAWEAFKLTDEYANSLRWAKVCVAETDADRNVKFTHPHLEGSMWNLFMRGWLAREKKSP